jgi:putative SOS response-associated peptidase YedK
MCGRYELNATPADIATHFGAVLREYDPEPFSSYNIAPSMRCPVIRYSKRDGRNIADRLVWGFQPEWSKRSWINARHESLFTAPAFRDAAARRRCLVIASGWYEWQRHGKHSKPFYVRLAGQPVLAFAGVWTARKIAGDWELNFAIVTSTAREGLEAIHERMPFVLAPSSYAGWLDPETPAPAALLEPTQSPPTAREVSSFVNDPRHDGAECVMATEVET